MNKVIAEKIDKGETLTDAELATAAWFYKKLSEDLLLLGAKFYLPFAECNRIYYALDGYTRNRKSR